MERPILLDAAIKQIEFVREYTLSLLADLDGVDWFRCAEGCPTNLAWQVGHLAMAQYGLCLYRTRGRKSEDLQLMSSDFRKKYSRGTTASSDPTGQPTPKELLAVLSRVHQQVMEELPTFSAEQLADPVDMPYAVTPTKLGAVLFCPLHEMIHAGQIGLLRRLLGKDPVR